MAVEKLTTVQIYMRSVVLVLLVCVSLCARGAQLDGSAREVAEGKAKFMDFLRLSCFDLGENGIAVAGANYTDGSSVVMFKGDGTYAWTQKFPIYNKWNKESIFAHSSDGNDFYSLGFTHGGKVIHVDRIDVKSGSVEKEVFDSPGIKSVLCTYATSQYLFLLTSEEYYDAGKFIGNPSVSLYRFDKSKKFFKKLTTDSGIVNSTGTFKQFVRVTEDCADAYSVKNVSPKSVTLNFERLDTNGRQLRSAEVTLTLERTFTRLCNSEIPLTRGITLNAMPNRQFSFVDTVITWTGIDGKKVSSSSAYKITPNTGSCYVLFDDQEQCYYVYGLCGPEYKATERAQYTGLYVAKLDTAFQLLTMKEHPFVSLLTNKLFLNFTSPVAARYLDGYIDPVTENLILHCYAANERILFTVNNKDLSLENARTRGGYYYSAEGSRMVAGDAFLGNDEHIERTINDSKSSIFVRYISSATREYVVMADPKKKTVTASSREIAK